MTFFSLPLFFLLLYFIEIITLWNKRNNKKSFKKVIFQRELIMKFLADMGIAMRIVEWLRTQNHDVIHLREEGLHYLSDVEIFKKAVSENRIILTFDLDFGEIVALSGGRLVSIILFLLRNTRTPYVLKRFEHILGETSNSLKKGAVVIVEDVRHRIRELPIKDR